MCEIVKQREIVNEIFLRRQSRLIISKGSGSSSPEEVATFLKNIESLGYTFSSTMIELLMNFSPLELKQVLDEIIPTLKGLRGDVKYNPMYPNFPDQLMSLSDAELYINAILHYFGDGIGLRILPDYEREKRAPLLESVKLTVIDLGDTDSFHQIFYQLMSSKTSISTTDMSDLSTYLQIFRNEARIPDSIPFKEILANVAASALVNDIEFDLSTHFRTATDILRLVTAMSGGDVSLADNTCYSNFSRSIRKKILALIEISHDIAENMYPYRMKWIRLGELLHPGDYASKFPKTFEAFDKIRNDVKIERFNSKLERYLSRGDIAGAVSLLKTRPGIFARRLDHILRLAKENAGDYLGEFSLLVDRVATPVVFQLMDHFRSRANPPDMRIFMPKGSIAKMQVVPNDLPHLEKELCDMVVKICKQSLINRFRKLEPLGRVFVDPGLKQFNIPFSQRSASASMRTIVRGSRLDIPPGNTIRLFIWWKDIGDQRVDIDLSAILFGSSWEYLEHVSYTNLRSVKYHVLHSGDITSAPSPASEFIDIDMQSLLKYGARYLMMSISSFTRQAFSQMPDAFAGWMIRKEVQSGEIFEPSTVQDKFNLTADTRISVPMIFDLKERKMIWADLALKNYPNFRNNIESNYNNLQILSKSIVSLQKATLFDLFSLHAEARGTPDDEEPDIVFSVENGTPFELEKIIGDYL